MSSKKSTSTKKDLKQKGGPPAIVQKDELDEIQVLYDDLKNQSLDQLKEMLKLAKEGKHPINLLYDKHFDKKVEESLRETEISYETKMKAIEEEYQKNKAAIEAKQDAKVVELKVEMAKELEQDERKFEIDYKDVDIAKPLASVTDAPKKNLRNRGPPISEAPSTMTPAAKAACATTILANVKYLLSEKEIEEDLKLFESAATRKQEDRKKSKNVVALQKGKFVINRTNFKLFEELLVENSEYGKIPARVENITDLVVSFKGTQSWDTRQIHASQKDLIEGRVQVYKRK